MLCTSREPSLMADARQPASAAHMGLDPPFRAEGLRSAAGGDVMADARQPASVAHLGLDPLFPAEGFRSAAGSGAGSGGRRVRLQ